ncbi:hypothetical protein P171DRAFT_490999 [Karstenula rhodostoma CBS 690.94]|uniref:Uncharacterized protein n=1 Tax=Karstenula rhodostoma CBS 690.94 TaxID=1392251 RepID=A0A9P4P6K9_9PLEO|nr:hypothetical protein P171DRAFT_490999 [Karstenula rhodostoma CBS 690.94]
MEAEDPFFDGYETFHRFLENCADNDHYLPEPEICRIRSVSAFLARMRQACTENARLDVAELMHLFAALESIGARGWFLVWQSNKTYEKMWMKLHDELQAKDAELEEAKERNKKLDEDRDELSRHLARVVERLEPLVNQLNQLHVTQQPLDSAPSPNRTGTPSVIDDDDEEFRTYSSGWGTDDLPTIQEPKEMRKRRSSSIVTEVGDIPDDPSTSYPPPLAPATEEGRKADERKMSMLSEVENTLWIQESKDREYLLKRPGPPPTVCQPPPSSQSNYTDPFYIYIPLPANFTIPQAQSNPQLPSLVFPTPPAVFHFPECGTRDQLLQILRQGCAGGVGDEHLEPIEDINIIRVRTHELEWELKNAIRKTLTGEEWDDTIGDDWYTEGRGDTYIVSKRDVHFREPSGSSTAGSGNKGKSRKAPDDKLVKDGADHEGRPEYSTAHPKGEGKEPEDAPQLRGGALTPYPSISSSASIETSYSSQSSRRLGGDNENSPSAPVQQHVPAEHLHAWIDQARILQLQNASHGRMINHLEEIIKDVEGTVEWQDEELALAHRHIKNLQRKVRERSAETLAAGRMAEFARAETQLLQEQLQEIHNQVVTFCAELDENERHILAHYPGLSTSESPNTAELRGGGDSPHGAETPSSVQAPTDEPATPAIEAHSFYFFPSVSMIVLLSSPLHHFQFPKHTSLPRVRQVLQNLHMEGKETNPHLRQVREILEARDEAGITLPDTSNGRQVLISAPETNDSASVSDGKPGYKGSWNRTFGPTEYQYEHMLKDSINNLKPPTANDRSSLSPTASVYEEKFHDTGVLVDTISPLGSPDEDEFYNAGDLIDTIEHEAEISRVRSAQKLADLSKDAVKGRSRGDSLSKKRGYGMSLPLPPTTLGPMFPTGSGSVTGDHLTPLPIGTAGVKAWRLDPHPPPAPYPPPPDSLHPSDYKKGPATISNIGLRHNPLSLSRLFSSSSPDTHPQTPPPTDPSTEAGWGMWRHPPDAGCERWLDPAKLDPLREACAFCGLAFTEKPWREWEFDEGPGRDAGRDVGPGDPYLRGGAEEVEWA